MAKNTMRSIFLAIIVILFIALSAFVSLYTDFLWFNALEYSQIFLISLKSAIGLFFASVIIFLIFAGVNLIVSSKISNKSVIPARFKFFILLIISVFVGMSTSKNWFIVLQFLNQFSFNLSDPIFGRDAAFYTFSLPFYNFIWTFMFSTLILTLILVTLNYLESYMKTALKRPEPIDEKTAVMPKKGYLSELNKLGAQALSHLAFLVALIFGTFAYKNYFDRFKIMFSEQGIVVGAGYTDTLIVLPAIKILMYIAIAVAVVFLIWMINSSKKIKKRHILAFAVVAYLLVNVVGTMIIPAIVQSLKVSPNEINVEKPYIENNIKFTKIAYGLTDIREEEYDVSGTLTSNILTTERETLDNVRILDWRPLTDTYKQTQEIRLYYDLSGIDIDRYYIDGKYSEVMIAVRELDQNKILPEAQTWVNLHQIYTHGNGIVMSPVNKVTEAGLPEYLIKDIPPIATTQEINLKITNPRIYYGEKSDNFVIVNTKTEEFDYPQGDTNRYFTYDGKGGVTLDSFNKKLLMAFFFGDIKILLSDDITTESKIMFHRNIKQRVAKLAPFLALDDDPYVVIDKGKIFWIQDAYTVSSNFPYSQKFKVSTFDSINYIRNSVKIVVDAYEGSVDFYIIDNEDPIIKTYSKIYPDVFKPIESMPNGIFEHIRYPEDIFRIQSEIYSTYHMNDPTVFYNKEDAWQLPYEVYGVNQKVLTDPYYIIMKLPGEEKEEFVLMTSFTPIKKDNMIAWFAARNDEDYGKLVLFKFPKDKLISGPLQVEAKFDQDSTISEQLTLWSQQGSQVLRGNLLVIPIRDTLLYIEPLYLQAENAQLPELKRILVSDGEKTIMEKDLATALAKLLSVDLRDIPELEGEDLAGQANEYYKNILASMNSGDWSSFGQNFDNLGKILDKLNE